MARTLPIKFAPFGRRMWADATRLSQLRLGSPNTIQVKRELPHVKVFPGGREVCQTRLDHPEGSRAAPRHKRLGPGATAASERAILRFPLSTLILSR